MDLLDTCCILVRRDGRTREERDRDYAVSGKQDLSGVGEQQSVKRWAWNEAGSDAQQDRHEMREHKKMEGSHISANSGSSDDYADGMAE